MQTLSLCMIVKDEEKHINICLKSIFSLLDEIIIIDTGSRDNTKKICQQYTEKIYDYNWDYDFGKARTYSFSLASSDYILWLDADDVISPKDYLKLKNLKKSLDGSIDIYNLWYDYRHDINGKCIYTFYRERIIKNTPDIYWDCIVHELLHFKSEAIILNTDIRVTHTNNHDNSQKYITFFKNKLDTGYTLNPREKYFYAIELIKNNNLKEAVPYLQAFTEDTSYNYSYNNSYELSSAYYNLANYYKLNANYKLAIKNYNLQISYHQPSIQTYYALAECHLALGNYDSAIFYLTTILEIDFPEENFTNGSHFNISEYFHILRQYRSKSLLTLIIINYYYLKDINKAKLFNNKLLLLDPENESALYNKNFFDTLK